MKNSYLATMFFFLSKILDFLVAPLTWIVALLLFALLTKNALRRKKLLLTSVILLLFFSNGFIYNEFTGCWEVPRLSPAALAATYDAGIILSGMVSYDESLDRIHFNRNNDRLMQAIALYKKGKLKKLFFTGGSGSLTYPEKKEALLIKKFVSELGIPENDFIIESESNNTHENATLSKPLLEKNFGSGAKYLLITSSFHMRRSWACFKKEGIEVEPFSVDQNSRKRTFDLGILLIPAIENLSGWNSLIHEWVGMLTYKIMGYA